jgi:hypothetical protein
LKMNHWALCKKTPSMWKSVNLEELKEEAPGISTPTPTPSRPHLTLRILDLTYAHLTLNLYIAYKNAITQDNRTSGHLEFAFTASRSSSTRLSGRTFDGTPLRYLEHHIKHALDSAPGQHEATETHLEA